MASFCVVLFPLDVLDEIWDLIELVSEGFLTYSLTSHCSSLTKLKPMWRDNNKSLGSKVKLMRSLVISIFLYAYESWTLIAELETERRPFR